MSKTMSDKPKRQESPLLKYLLTSAAIILIVLQAQAQPNKAIRFMEEGRYDAAAKVLKKDFFSKKPGENSGYLLAQCYYKLQDYEDAYDIMSLIQDEIEGSGEKARFFMDVLIANDDFSSAYLEVLRRMAEGDSDPKTYLWFKKISDLIKWDTTNTGSLLEMVSGINTPYNEYAPIVDENLNMHYVTDINSMQSIFPASYSGQNIHLIYRTRYRERDRSIERPVMAVKNRKYYDHDGPFAPWPGRDLHAVTLREAEVATQSARMGIYFLNFKSGEEPTPFVHNGEYQTGHPTFSEDGSRMYFASNRPGGFGQMDLWYCDWQGGHWSEPVNMGPVINTPSNEMFPRFHLSRLFFSSDRRDMGYGGLDMYMSSALTNFKSVANLRAPINSAYDDFAIGMLNHVDGFVSSNRPSGIGGDDIYRIVFYPEKADHKDRVVRFKDVAPPAGTIARIMQSSGELLQEVEVDDKGKFVLKGAKSLEQYTLELENHLVEGMVIEVLDEQGEPVQSFEADKTENVIRFELLSPKSFDRALVKRDTEGPQPRFPLKGRVQSDKGESLAETELSLEARGGKLISSTKTDQEGRFDFGEVDYEEDFTIKTSGVESPHRIDILGESGAVVQSIETIGVSSNAFNYSRSLPQSDWMLASPVLASGTKAILISDNVDKDTPLLFETMDGKEAEEILLDAEGRLNLGDIQSKEAYRIRSQKGQFSPNDRLFLLNQDGDTLQRLSPYDESEFRFEYMPEEKGRPRKAPKPEPEPIPEAFEPGTFVAHISDFDFGEAYPMLLLTVGEDQQDTVYVRSNGNLVLRNLHPDKRYELVVIKDELNKEAILRIRRPDGTDALIETQIDDEQRFSFRLLDAEDYELGGAQADDGNRIDLFGKSYSDKDLYMIPVVLYTGQDSLEQGESFLAKDGSMLFKNVERRDQYLLYFGKGIPEELYVKRPQGDYVKARRIGDLYYEVDFSEPPIAEEDLPDAPDRREQREFTVPHIYFDFNSYYVKAESRRSLDMFTRYMKQNPDISIEIRAYTDCRGSDAYNITLSERRAGSVKEYLSKKGVESERMRTRGFGERYPVNDCVDGVECTEEEHALNRRVTFIILD